MAESRTAAMVHAEKRSQLDRDLEEEIEFHLEMKVWIGNIFAFHRGVDRCEPALRPAVVSCPEVIEAGFGIPFFAGEPHFFGTLNGTPFLCLCCCTRRHWARRNGHAVVVTCGTIDACYAGKCTVARLCHPAKGTCDCGLSGLPN